MAGFPSDLTNLLPDSKTVVYAFVTFLASQAFTRFRARRTALYWTANYQRIVPQPDDPVAPKLSITFNNLPVVNFQAYQIYLRNESGTDVDTFEVLVAFDDPFVIVESFAAVDSSAKRLIHSDEFTKTVKYVESLAPSDREKNASAKYLLTSREFAFPALNRGETATLRFWVHSSVNQAVPNVRVTTEKKGVKIIHRAARFQALDIAELKRALPVGLFVSLLVIFTISAIPMSPRSLAFASCIAGASCGLLGIGLVRFARYLKRLV